MRCFSTTTVVHAPQEHVWAVLADVTRWPRWLPTVTSVEPLGPPALEVGARYRLRQPRLRPAVWQVVTYAPPARFSWESRSPGVRALADHVLQPLAGPATQVSLEVAFTGSLAWIAGLVAGRITREYLEREAAALRAELEGGAGSRL